MTRITFKRGTRAQLNSAASSNALIAGEPYFITDEGRLAIGLSASTYEVFAKVSEGGYPSIAYPKRSSAPKVVGDVAGTALTTLGLTASRLYYFPLVVPRNVVLIGLRISVTTAASGAVVSVGIYGNTTVSGNDAPGSLLASVSNLDATTTGNKDGALSYTLVAGTLYWIGLISNAAPTLRHILVAAVQTSLGRDPSSASIISYLYASGSGSTLPATAPTSFTISVNAALPCVYLLE
jgi:hypothetical protein